MTDVKDWSAAHVTDLNARREADKHWAKANLIHPVSTDWRESAMTAAELQRKTFPPIQYIVPGIIPEGLSLLVGRPKIGKSWLALDFGLTIASGRACLAGREPQQGDVLYCALEDNPRRLQARITRVLGVHKTDWPKRLTLTTQWRRLDKGGVADIAEWIKSVTEPRLVILDTLASVKPIRTTSGYAEDYESLTHLHRLANDVGVGILVLHHQRKNEAEDPLDTISGTLGLAGCVDTPIILSGSSAGMTLYVRGRDIEEAEHAIRFDKDACRWLILGDAVEVQRSDTRKKILEVLQRAKPNAMGPSDIAAAAELKESVVKVRLGGMVADNEVVKTSRGLYAHP
jgi:predicted ATP-dependent serine protease